MLQDIPPPTLREACPCVLETERLSLRRPTLADVKAIARLANDRRIAENTRRLPFPNDEAHAIDFVQMTAGSPSTWPCWVPTASFPWQAEQLALNFASPA